MPLRLGCLLAYGLSLAMLYRPKHILLSLAVGSAQSVINRRLCSRSVSQSVSQHVATDGAVTCGRS